MSGRWRGAAIRWVGRAGLALALALALGYLPYRLRAGAMVRYLALREDARHAQERLDRLRADGSELRREVRGLNSDLVAVERAARQDLGLVRPGDLVLRLPAEAAR